MNAIAKETQSAKDLEQLKTRPKNTTWMAGDYDLFCRYLDKDAERFFRGSASHPWQEYFGAGPATSVDTGQTQKAKSNCF